MGSSSFMHALMSWKIEVRPSCMFLCLGIGSSSLMLVLACIPSQAMPLAERLALLPFTRTTVGTKWSTKRRTSEDPVHVIVCATDYNYMLSVLS